MSTFFTSAQLYSGTGCFVTAEPSFFSGSINVTGSGVMTHEMCYNTCAIPGSGYQYFGLYSTGNLAGEGDGCECSAGITGSPSPLPTQDCIIPCAGNSTEMCGGESGGNSLVTVYEIIGASLSVPGWRNLGCHTDVPYPNNALGMDGLATIMDTAPDNLLTPKSCAEYCSEYQYFSIENGDACYCGDTLNSTSQGPNIGEPAESTSCDWACAGDPGAACGAALYMNLYSNSAYPQSTTTVLSLSSTTATPEISTTETVAASPTSTSVSIPGLSAPIPVDNGTIWYSFTGCHSVTNETFPTSDNSTFGMTVTLCLSFCASSNPAFNYSVISGTDCYCSNDLSANGAIVSSLSDSECMAPCPGNPSEACAGSPSLPYRKRGEQLYTLSPVAIYQVVAAPVAISSTSSISGTSSMSTNSGGDALSTSTVYDTETITITSCAPAITNCPARTYTTSAPTAIVVYSEEVASNSTTMIPITTMSWAPYMTVPGAGITPAGGYALPTVWPTYPYPSHSAISAAVRSGISFAWSSVAFLGSMVLPVFWF